MSLLTAVETASTFDVGHGSSGGGGLRSGSWRSLWRWLFPPPIGAVGSERCATSPYHGLCGLISLHPGHHVGQVSGGSLTHDLPGFEG